MEFSLDSALGAALGLNSFQNTIVCSNMNILGKIYILRSLLHISYMSSKTIKKYDDVLNKIATMTEERNSVAHHLFLASDDRPTVEFFKTRAKGKLEYPEMKWTIDDFRQRFERLMQWARTLDKLPNDLVKEDVRARLARLLTQPNLGFGPPDP